MSKNDKTMDEIVAFSKRRGFVFPSGEIYGGFANSYAYGPYGAALKKNIKDLWWKMFVEERADMVGLDGGILLHPRTWKASGHVDTFNDPLVDCKKCRSRHRADHVVESAEPGLNADGMSLEQLGEMINEKEIACPRCGSKDFTDVRQFNLMFQTQLAKTGEDSTAYLRPETAQAIFVEFKNIIDTGRAKVPFGVGQIGKAFRNEITPGNFIFRTLEFEQMEVEYFVHPDQWEQHFDTWRDVMWAWCDAIGLSRDMVHELEVEGDARAHYSKRTIDFEFDYPFGRKELYGLAYRTDHDLKAHEDESGNKLRYRDPQTGEEYIPHVIEPSLGVDRSFLAVLLSAYQQEELEGGKSRIVLKLPKQLAPVKIAVFPLMKNKPELVAKAREVFTLLSKSFVCEFDDNGNVGKRYRRQDEIGTPYCVTIDFDTLEDGSVTVRDRDTMAQERVALTDIEKYFINHLQS